MLLELAWVSTVDGSYGVDTCDGPSDFGASWYRVVTGWLISHVGGGPDMCVGGGDCIQERDLLFGTD